MKVSDNHMTYEIHPDVYAGTVARDEALPCPIIQMNQVHDVKVAVVDRVGIPQDELDGCDAIMTDLPGVAIGVRSADCIPVLLYDPVKKAAAAIHSGWRGTVSKIISKTVAQMRTAYSSQPSDLLAFIGPGICMDCFQVGEEVALKFKEAGFDIDSLWAFRGPKTGNGMEGGHHIDLKEACRQTLVEYGLKNENIQITGLCTYDDNDLLYSARKEGIECGRNITYIKIL